MFIVTLALLESKVDRAARKGNAMNARLGEPELALDSVEGLVAKVVYRNQIGDHVFRRITPISRILQQAGVCESDNGLLRLR